MTNIKEWTITFSGGSRISSRWRLQLQRWVWKAIIWPIPPKNTAWIWKNLDPGGGGLWVPDAHLRSASDFGGSLHDTSHGLSLTSRNKLLPWQLKNISCILRGQNCGQKKQGFKVIK